MTSSSGLTLAQDIPNTVQDNWYRACKLDDLIPQSGICALVNRQQIALFFLPALEDGIFAIANWDPIGKANVLSRGIVGDIGGEPVVASPLYKQHFSLRTGDCLEDEEVQVPTYRIKCIGDGIMVQVLP